MLTVLITVAYPQPSSVRFRHISVEDGLSSSQVTSIVQDKKGFMWFGTWKGLNRYDGYSFKVFRHNPKDSLSLSDGGITALLNGRDGVVWVGTSTGLDRFDGETETFVHYVFENKDSSIRLQNNNVFALCEDQEGYIWAGCRYGLHRLSPASGEIKSFTNIPGNPKNLSHNFITSICQTEDGTLWVGTLNGLNRLDPATGICQRFLANPNDPQSPATIRAGRILEVVEDGKGLLYIRTNGGLDVFDLKNPHGGFQHLPWAASAILPDQMDGSIWLGTPSGLRHQFGADTSLFEEFRYRPGNPDGLSSASVNILYKDKEGSIWIGTKNGLNLLTPDAFQFRHFKNDPGDPNSLSHNVVLSVFESRDGAVWLGTMGGGLNRLDPKTGNVRRYPFDEPGSPSSTNSGQIFRIVEDHKGTIWAGLTNRGVDRLDMKSGRFSHKTWGDIRDMVSFFYEDKDSVLWIGHQGGVSRFDRLTGGFEFSPYAPEAKGKGGLGVVTGILEDHTGAWWVCSNGYYLNRFDPLTMQYKRYLPDPKNPGSIRSDNIQAIYEDRKGQLWVAAMNGLDLFNRKTETFTHFGLEDGLPDLVIGHLLEDGAGRLWMATGRGITRYEAETKTFHNYDKTDGLSSNESWDFIKSPSTGAFLLATADGLTIFHPDSLQRNQVAPTVVFTKYSRYNSKQNREVEEKGITETQSLTLSYRDDILTFQFAALSFRKSSKNQYAYKLEGFNDQWIQLGTKREVTFTNLDPGTYTLRVKGSNGDGVWNEDGASLKITITPPWWAAWWAKVIYLLTAGGLFYGVWRYELNRRLANAEAHRLQELDAVKSHLYTNITHEFRTPLTIISGMADEVRHQPQERLGDSLDMIKRNSQSLLLLVNQMLDLSKIESGNMPLHLVQGDVVGFLKYVFESFHSLAEAKNIRMEMQSDEPAFFMDYDPEKLLQIVSNLLSNAIKFTPEGGSVELAVSSPAARQSSTMKYFSTAGLRAEDCLLLTVSDTGTGIAPEKLPYIFDRFYQAEGETTRQANIPMAIGTGIGLTLTKELVKLLGGSISVESPGPGPGGKGTVFTVALPVTRQAVMTEPQTNVGLAEVTAPAASVVPPAKKKELPQVLIIEDNPDVVQYLSACIESDYSLAVARNGQEGIDMALESVPDLIISDVMMPEMDGYEVCQTLKNDVRTSHIPIVLLTAKADQESKIEGLERGADAYIPKPFNKEELLIRMRKLLELRQRLQHYYSAVIQGENAPPYTPEVLLISGPDDAFVQKVKEIIEAHIVEPAFSLPQLCKEIHMSRSQLYRKLMALTGHSPTRFIRQVRLAKAKQQLLETEDSIQSIAFDNGFTDPNYFTRIFQKEAGVSPSRFRELARTN